MRGKHGGAVRLPRYVWSRTNSARRTYYTYTRFRGTERQWPHVPLPFDAQDQLFWLRCRQPTQASREKKAAMARLREAGVVFHGLRKNAVNMLLEAGCTEAEVSAIVEMSEQMVRHYSKDVNKRRLAVNAMKKLEEAWKVVDPRLFGASVGGVQ